MAAVAGEKLQGVLLFLIKFSDKRDKKKG